LLLKSLDLDASFELLTSECFLGLCQFIIRL
jgi:hypothetical protein